MVSTGALGFRGITNGSPKAHNAGGIADLGITAMPLGNVLHELLPLFKISWLDWLFQLPIKVAPLKRLGASADIGVRPMDKVIFDLGYSTPFISIRKQKRYLDISSSFTCGPDGTAGLTVT